MKGYHNLNESHPRLNKDLGAVLSRPDRLGKEIEGLLAVDSLVSHGQDLSLPDQKGGLPWDEGSKGELFFFFITLFLPVSCLLLVPAYPALSLSNAPSEAADTAEATFL